MTLLERLRENALATPLPFSEARRLQLVEWFNAHEGEDGCYSYHDGRIGTVSDLQKRCLTRTSSLVVIAQDGFPMYVSRWSALNRKGGHSHE